MTIFTISFTGRSTKTYDYIVSNPNNYDVDASKLLKFVIGIDHSGPRYSTARIVRVSHPDSLPYQVTTCLDVNAGNVVVSRKLDDAQLAKLRALKPTPATTKPIAPIPTKTPVPVAKAEPATIPYVLTERDVQRIAFFEERIRQANKEEWDTGFQSRTRDIARWMFQIQKIKEGKYNYECI